MDLKAFLRSLPDEPARVAFAVACKTSIGHLRNVGSGLRPLALETAVAVERESGGKVTCDEARADVCWSRIPDKAWKWHAKGRPVVDVSRVAA